MGGSEKQGFVKVAVSRAVHLQECPLVLRAFTATFFTFI